MRLIMKKVDGEEDGGDYIEVGILHVHFQLAKILSTKCNKHKARGKAKVKPSFLVYRRNRW